MRLFKKEERSSFPYWFAHMLSFNLIAVLCGVWKFKYLFHDIEKPFLKLIWPYEKVQKWHRKHNRHHLEYKDPNNIDWIAWAIDNECGRLSKENSPLTCMEYFHYYKDVRYPNGEISKDKLDLIEANAPRAMQILGLTK